MNSFENVQKGAIILGLIFEFVTGIFFYNIFLSIYLWIELNSIIIIFIIFSWSKNFWYIIITLPGPYVCMSVHDQSYYRCYQNLSYSTTFILVKYLSCVNIQSQPKTLSCVRFKCYMSSQPFKGLPQRVHL